LTGLQVAPHPRSSRLAWVAFPGCPVRAPFSPSWRPMPQVAPWLRSFGCAGDDPLRSPRTSHTFDVAGFNEVPGFPGGTRFPPAAPAIQSSGCPASHISGLTGDGSSSRLDSHILRRCRLRKLPSCPGVFAPPVSPTISTRVAPNTHPPAPADHCPSHLGSRMPSGSPWSISRVAPVPLPWLR